MMKKVFILIFAMGVIVAFVSPVSADLISQNAHYDFSIAPGASSFQDYGGFEFDPFDEQGGTLTLEKVILSYSIGSSAHVTVENTDEYMMAGPIVLTSTVHLDIDNLSDSAVDMYSDEPMIDLDPSDGVIGSGPDFYDYGTLSLDGFGYYDTTYNPSDLDKFIDPDPVLLTFDGSAGFTLSGSSSGMVDLGVSDFTVSMNATLTYEYSVVPEPATVLLFGLGGLGLRKRSFNHRRM